MSTKFTTNVAPDTKCATKSKGETFALDKAGQRYGPGSLIAVALRNPHEESGASLVFAIVQEILTHDEDGVPYKHVTRHDPASRTITPHEGGFAVLAEPIAESHNSATSLLKDAQLQVFDRVNNILALPTRTKDDLLTDARLYADK